MSASVELVCPKTTNLTPFFTACLTLRYKIGSVSLRSSAQIIMASDLLRSSIFAFSIFSSKNPLNKRSSFRYIELSLFPNLLENSLKEVNSSLVKLLPRR